MPKIIENVRTRLLEEARNMLLEFNYHELNMRTIAKRCNIGIGTFYNYFPNKEAIIGEIFRTDWLLVSHVTAAAESNGLCFKENCHLIYDAIHTFIKKYSDVFYELSMSANQPKGCPAQNKYDIIYDQMENLIAKSLACGDIISDMSPKQLSRFLISNFIYASKHEYIDFETLYNGFNLKKND